MVFAQDRLYGDAFSSFDELGATKPVCDERCGLGYVYQTTPYAAPILT
jgi:hypothetical protein